MWFDLAWSLGQGRDKTLSGRSRRFIELLASARNDSPEERAAKYDYLAQATPEGSLIQVFAMDGRRLYPLGAATAFPWPDLKPQADAWSTAMFQKRHYRVLVRAVTDGAPPFRIFVAGQLEDNRVMLARFSEGLQWAIPPLLILCALSGYFVSRRALNPVDRLIASARSISIGNLSRRLPISGSGDELERLAMTCNDMLARLEDAVSRITRFTADASHELRSPLSFIRTVAECSLRTPGLDPELAEAFRDIVTESEQASRLLEDMLTLARSDAGHAQINFEMVSLTNIVHETTAKMRTLAEAKEQTLGQSIGGEHLLIDGDGATLRRLVRILIDNAIKYTPRNGRIDVTLAELNGAVHLQVKDTGVGIPASALPHVFERFFRVDPSRGQEEGTGLGLAIAKWIADAHHARITVDSIEHWGTTFEVVFPLAEKIVERWGPSGHVRAAPGLIPAPPDR